MALNSAEWALIALATVLSMVGGIPHLLGLIKPKPHLKITESTITKLPNDSFRYLIHLQLENQTKWWKRSRDASNVIGEYYMIDKNGMQWGTISNQTVSPYLVAGAKIAKDIEGYHSFLPEGNPYTIVFRVTCSEGQIIKQKVTYNVSQ